MVYYDYGKMWPEAKGNLSKKRKVYERTAESTDSKQTYVSVLNYCFLWGVEQTFHFFNKFPVG